MRHFYVTSVVTAMRCTNIVLNRVRPEGLGGASHIT